MESQTLEVKPRFLSPDDLAVRWDVSTKTITRLLDQGELPHFLLPCTGTRKRKRHMRIKIEDVERFEAAHMRVGSEPVPVAPVIKHRRKSVLTKPEVRPHVVHEEPEGSELH